MQKFHSLDSHSLVMKTIVVFPSQKTHFPSAPVVTPNRADISVSSPPAICTCRGYPSSSKMVDRCINLAQSPTKNATARRFPKKRRRRFPCICMRAGVHAPMWHGGRSHVGSERSRWSLAVHLLPSVGHAGKGTWATDHSWGSARHGATEAWRPINADGQDGWHECVLTSGGRSKHMSASRNQCGERELTRCP